MYNFDIFHRQLGFVLFKIKVVQELHFVGGTIPYYFCSHPINIIIKLECYTFLLAQTFSYEA